MKLLGGSILYKLNGKVYIYLFCINILNTSSNNIERGDNPLFFILKSESKLKKIPHQYILKVTTIKIAKCFTCYIGQRIRNIGVD